MYIKKLGISVADKAEGYFINSLLSIDRKAKLPVDIILGRCYIYSDSRSTTVIATAVVAIELLIREGRKINGRDKQ